MTSLYELAFLLWCVGCLTQWQATSACWHPTWGARPTPSGVPSSPPSVISFTEPLAPQLKEQMRRVRPFGTLSQQFCVDSVWGLVPEPAKPINQCPTSATSSLTGILLVVNNCVLCMSSLCCTVCKPWQVEHCSTQSHL